MILAAIFREREDGVPDSWISGRDMADWLRSDMHDDAITKDQRVILDEVAEKLDSYIFTMLAKQHGLW